MREEFLPMLAKHLNPKVYVELGVGYVSIEVFNKMITTIPNAEKWGVDIVDLAPYIHKGANVNFYHGTTVDFLENWTRNKAQTIDLMFIDADHSANAVLTDVSLAWPLITPDTGIMVLHDTWPISKDWTGPEKSGDCFKVPRQLKDDYDDMEILTVPVPHGLTLIRKVGDSWRNNK